MHTRNILPHTLFVHALSRACVGALLAIAVTALAPVWAQSPQVDARIYAQSNGLGLYQKPRLPVDAPHYPFVNPNAPKGGKLTLGARDGFDNFNILASKGRTAAGLSLIYQTLTQNSPDEPFSVYGLLAQSLELAEDGRAITFTLREDATWHDGVPITARDVAFSFEFLLSEDGPVMYRSYYDGIDSVDVLSEKRVRVNFKTADNAELPLIVGQAPIVPEHYWRTRDLTKTTLEIPLGSGPYRIEAFQPDQSITYTRVKNHWTERVPVNIGFYNFDTISYDYYKSDTVLLEAFKAGDIDLRAENIASNWANGYDIPARERGDIILERFPVKTTVVMQGFLMNMRRPIFANPAVREAVAFAFDFDYANRVLFYGQYQRARSYFNGSELESSGLPEGDELVLLRSLGEGVPERVFTQIYQPPQVGEDGIRSNRELLKRGAEILDQAGIAVAQNGIRQLPDGTPLQFELLLYNPTFEKVALPFVSSLKRLGIEATVRTITIQNYITRLNEHDFDMIISTFGQSDSPGNEQRDFFSSQTADLFGSRNTAGIRNPALDKLIESLAVVTTRRELVTHVHALDRILQWSFLMVPHYYSDHDRIAYWNRFGKPSRTPEKGPSFLTWWIDSQKDTVLDR